MTTTAIAIRDLHASLIEAITPASESRTSFRKHRDEMPFEEWVASNPNAALRRFSIYEDGYRRAPPISNAGVEYRYCALEIMVAYPNNFRYGSSNRSDQEALMVQDAELVEDAIGLRGFANFSDSTIIASEFSISRIDADAARFIRINTTHAYYRSTNYVAI